MRIKLKFEQHLRMMVQITCALLVWFGGAMCQRAVAQEPVASDGDTQVLLRRIDGLEHALALMQAKLDAMSGKVAEAVPIQDMPQTAIASLVQVKVAEATTSVESPAQSKHGFMERKPGKDLTFYTPNGELTAYGNLDVSFDVMTKGMGSLIGPDGSGPVGNTGWLSDLSTNISYVGLRGTQWLGSRSLAFVYQLETEIDIASPSATSESNSSETNTVKGGLTSRNSFVGISSTTKGSLVFGKAFGAYKLATARLNPFTAMIGDYSAILGNSGGDNRVEFGTMLDHSVWYTSPMMHGVQGVFLFSPGQNRSNVSDNIAAGESDCTGNDIPGSGGSLPFACNDGAFSNAVSTSVSYMGGPLYATAAYEWHQKVNRQSDLTGEYANPPTAYFNADVANEDAAKIGLQYTFASKMTVSAIFESLHRYLPGFLEFQNERQRLGSWLAVSQWIDKNDSVAFGWARAYRTPGDPGQHNTSTVLPPMGAPGDGVGGRGVDNSANLFSAVYRHQLMDGLTMYMGWAATINGPYAHYDLGAGGRVVTTDCHDASDATGGESSNPHCWAGGHLMGASAGLNRRF